MIYTVTMNPSLDYMVSVRDLKLGCVNRTENEQILPGGKGINVSIVLNHLGIQTTAIGFIAGFTGDEISKRLRGFGFPTDFIQVNDGYSRINIKVDSGQETQINGKGPMIVGEEIQLLYKKLERLEKEDILVLAGNVPAALSNRIYGEICKRMQPKGNKVIVDAAGELLLHSLAFKPFLIKPNLNELEELFDKKLNSMDEILFYGKELQNMGARNVLVSLANDGAVLFCEHGEIYQENAAEGIAVNTIGSGDSMVAGFIAGYTQCNDFEQALKFGIAAGSASAFENGLAEKEEIMAILHKVCEMKTKNQVE